MTTYLGIDYRETSIFAKQVEYKLGYGFHPNGTSTFVVSQFLQFDPL